MLVPPAPVCSQLADSDPARRPAWGEEVRTVWARRRPLYEEVCTHTIASLTARPKPASPQFLMKHVETALLRLLHSIFGFTSAHIPLAAGPLPPPAARPNGSGGVEALELELARGAKGARTSFVALNFRNLLEVDAAVIQQVTSGVDVIELRVDTLVDPGVTSSDAATATGGGRFPSLEFVALCFGHLRRCSPLPILYTVRSEPQGGGFPNPYASAAEGPDRMAAYLKLVELGFKLGAEYVDVELALPETAIQRLLRLRGTATRVVGADHDREGRWRWDSEETLERYLRARRLGCDVVKLVSRASTLGSNLDLLNFRAKVESIAAASSSEPATPLLAINMGKGGQISRFLNPVLTPVTHPLLPGAAAPGQLTFQQTQQALFYSGLTLERTFHVAIRRLADIFAAQSERLGLPFSFVVAPAPERYAPNFGGRYITPTTDADLLTLSLSSVPREDDILPPARNTGYADLCVPIYDEPRSYDEPATPLACCRHTNIRVLALAEVVRANLSPINAVGVQTCAVLIALGPKDLAEVTEALRIVGARWILTLGCEGEVSSAIPAGEPEEGANGPTGATSRQKGVTAAAAWPYPERAPAVVVELESFADPKLYARRPPTIIISSDHYRPRTSPLPASGTDPASSEGGGDSGPPVCPDELFSSSTGGCALDLSSSPSAVAPSHPTRGLLAECIGRRRARFGNPSGDGWQVLSEQDVQLEADKLAFRALTGRRL